MSKSTIIILLSIMIAAMITLVYVAIIYRRIKRMEVKNEKIKEIQGYIHEGAMAFLFKEYKIIVPFLVGFAIILAVLGFIPALQSAEGVGWQSAICLLIGGLFSGLTGFLGMNAATASNGRTAYEAEQGIHESKEKGMGRALRVAFSGGSILGLGVVGLGLFGLVGLFFIFYAAFDLPEAVHVISGYGLGCSMIALFGRVGGGIYTKAADVGADLVGKVESNIPEDDPRNPAVIADNVGDNVGDIAGMGSDLCESYCGAIISALAIGLSIATTATEQVTHVLFVLLLAGIGVLASLLSAIVISSKQWKNPQKTLSLATYIATGIELVGAVVLSLCYLKDWKAIVAVVVGLAAGVLVGQIAEIYTSADYKAVKEIASESQTGHATNIIAGMGSGMQSTGLTIAVLAVAIAVSYFALGNFGIGIAAVSMLSVAGITISVDGYGPISDNAGGIAEMSGLEPEVREITDHLDSVGNTTAAIGKGFCIGSATLTALALFLSYAAAADLSTLDMLAPEVVVGLLIGAMLPYLFSSLTIKSVGKAANKMVQEVRRQFHEDAGILEGTSKPDYKRCVGISTNAALKEMVLPGVIALVSPILGGLILGPNGLGGMLIGALTSAIMLAVFMANSGGAWDNAKKYIEEGHFGGKGSEAHKAAVTGDTVGDPFKDTSGPAMDILVKLMCIISLIIAPILSLDGFKSLWEILVNLFNK